MKSTLTLSMLLVAAGAGETHAANFAVITSPPTILNILVLLFAGACLAIQAGAGRSQDHQLLDDLIATFALDQPTGDHPTHRMHHQAEALIVEDAPNVFIAVTPEDKIVGPRILNYPEAYDPVMGSTEDFYFFAVE